MGRTRTVLMGVLGLLALAILPLVEAEAATPNDAYLANLKGKKDAPAIITANNLTCDLQDAFFVGGTSVKVDGKTEKRSAYELACKARPGMIAVVDKDNKLYRETPCYQAELDHEKDKSVPNCILPANKSNNAWVAPWVQSIFPTCEVHGLRYIGKVRNEPQRLFEVACNGVKSGGAGFYTLPDSLEPNNGDYTPIAFVSCLRASGTDLSCKMTDKSATIANYKTLAATARQGCDLKEVNYQGASSQNNYYEIGCEDESDFVVVADKFDKFLSAITCDKASQYGAKCKYGGTVSAPAAGGEKSGSEAYSQQLASLGQTCHVLDFQVAGHEQNGSRDLIEFKCAETPYGLVGYMPRPHATGEADLTDCFVAKLRGYECRFYPYRAQDARIESLVASSQAIAPACELASVRYDGATADQELTVEIACKDHHGYMALMTAARDKFEQVVTCQRASVRKDWDKCQMPGNGSVND